ELRRAGAVGARIGAVGAVQLGPEVLVQLLAYHAVREVEGGEGAGVERVPDDARTALVDVARDDQHVAARRGERADLGRVVGLAVLMRGRDRDRTARLLPVALDRLGQTLAVVVVGVGEGDGAHALVLQDVADDFALARVGGR